MRREEEEEKKEREEEEEEKGKNRTESEGRREKPELSHFLSPGSCSGHQAGGRPGRQAGTIKASTVGCYEDLLGPAVPLSSEGIKNKLLRAST